MVAQRGKLMKTRLFLLVLLLIVAVTPGLAQEDTPPTITIAGLTLAVDPDFAPGINVMRYGEAQTDMMPVAPPHTVITLYDGESAVPGILEAAGTIMIYETAALAEGDSEYTRRYESLRTLLAEQTDFTAFMQATMPGESVETTLPFLPVFPAAQIIRALPEYVDLDGVSGISYVTAYAQALYPFTAGEFMLTFQGISDDGEALVTAVFPINIDTFPAEPPAADFDYDAFIATFETYLTESIDTINNADASMFTPSLATLNGIIESFVIE
jgi:hypothetical protein